METFFLALAGITFFVAMVACQVAWVRMVRANTRRVYWEPRTLRQHRLSVR